MLNKNMFSYQAESHISKKSESRQIKSKTSVSDLDFQWPEP